MQSKRRYLPFARWKRAKMTDDQSRIGGLTPEMQHTANTFSSLFDWFVSIGKGEDLAIKLAVAIIRLAFEARAMGLTK